MKPDSLALRICRFSLAYPQRLCHKLSATAGPVAGAVVGWGHRGSPGGTFRQPPMGADGVSVCAGRGTRAVAGQASRCGALRTRTTPTRRGRSQCHIQKRTEENTSELQSLMRSSYAVFGVKKKK